MIQLKCKGGGNSFDISGATESTPSEETTSVRTNSAAQVESAIHKAAPSLHSRIDSLNPLLSKKNYLKSNLSQPIHDTPTLSVQKLGDNLDKILGSPALLSAESGNLDEALEEIQDFNDEGVMASQSIIDSSFDLSNDDAAKVPLPCFNLESSESDQLLIETLPDACGPEILLIALNSYELLPLATASRPFIRLDLRTPCRLGRANMSKYANFIALQTSQVVSRSHLEFSFDESSDAFFVHDIGSHSGTWINGKRMSASGIESGVIEVKSGDEIHIGTNYRGTTTTDDLKLLHIHVRLLCRSWKVPDEKLDILSDSKFAENANDESEVWDGLALPNSTTTTLYRLDSKKTSDSSAAQLKRNPTINAIRKIVEQSTHHSESRTTIPSNAVSSIDSNNYPPSLRYFLSFLSANMPWRIKRIGVFAPMSTAEETVNDSHRQEVVKVDLRQWFQPSKRMIVFHDLRSKSQPRLFLEITRKDENVSEMVLLVADELKRPVSVARSPPASFTAYKVATFTQSTMRCTVQFCFEPLSAYTTDSQFLADSEWHDQYSTPSEVPKNPPQSLFSRAAALSQMTSLLSKGGSWSGRGSGGTSRSSKTVSGVQSAAVESSAFPSFTIVGDFLTIMSPTKSISIASSHSLHTPSPRKMASNSAEMGHSQFYMILKQPPPSRLQTLLGDVKGKQMVRKDVRESKWLIGFEIFEHHLMREMAAVAAATHGQEILDDAGVEEENSGPCKWRYRKEWWSLVLMGSIIYSLVKDTE